LAYFQLLHHFAEFLTQYLRVSPYFLGGFFRFNVFPINFLVDNKKMIARKSDQLQVERNSTGITTSVQSTANCPPMFLDHRLVIAFITKRYFAGYRTSSIFSSPSAKLIKVPFFLNCYLRRNSKTLITLRSSLQKYNPIFSCSPFPPGGWERKWDIPYGKNDENEKFASKNNLKKAMFIISLGWRLLY